MIALSLVASVVVKGKLQELLSDFAGVLEIVLEQQRQALSVVEMTCVRFRRSCWLDSGERLCCIFVACSLRYSLSLSLAIYIYYFYIVFLSLSIGDWKCSLRPSI